MQQSAVSIALVLSCFLLTVQTSDELAELKRELAESRSGQTNAILYWKFFRSKTEEQIQSHIATGDRWIAINAVWQLRLRGQMENANKDEFHPDVPYFLGFVHGRINVPVPVKFIDFLSNEKNDDKDAAQEKRKSIIEQKFKKEFAFDDGEKINLEADLPECGGFGGSVTLTKGDVMLWTQKLWHPYFMAGEPRFETVFADFVFSEDRKYFFCFIVNTSSFSIVEFDSKTGEVIGSVYGGDY